jgi:hypothetical protein
VSSAPDKKAIKASVASQDATDLEMGSQVLVAARERVELDGRSAFFKLRKHWSAALMIWISSFIIFHIAITVAVGLGALDFIEYQWPIPLITVENFLQIVGMGYVVVRFLYPNDINAAQAMSADR